MAPRGQKEVFLYARQSLDVQDSISIETQIEKAKAFLQPGEPYRIFTDRGFSGKNTKRPELQNMLKQIKEGRASKVIVYRLDRFSRSILDFAEMWSVFSANDVEFISCNERFDTSTPIGRAMVFIIMIFAQMERETISERVTDNYYERVKTGRWPGGPAPWGCNIGRLIVGNQKIPTLVYNSNMDILEEMFYRYYEDVDISLGKLGRELTDRGIPAPGKNAIWNNITLARLFRNPAFVKADADIYVYFEKKGSTIFNELEEFDGTSGCVLVGKRDANTRTRNEFTKTQLSLANWEGRIPSKIWIGVQNRLAQNKQISNNGKGRYTWLTGIIKCGYCKRALKVGGDRKDGLYCSGAHQNPNFCKHTGRATYSTKMVEAFVANELCKILEKCESQPIEETETFISNEDKMELIKIEKKIHNLMETLASDEISNLTIRYINEELAKLHAQHQSISDKMTIQNKRLVKFEQIQFDTLDFEGKKIVARSYIDKVWVFDDHIEILWLA